MNYDFEKELRENVEGAIALTLRKIETGVLAAKFARLEELEGLHAGLLEHNGQLIKELKAATSDDSKAQDKLMAVLGRESNVAKREERAERRESAVYEREQNAVANHLQHQLDLSENHAIHLQSISDRLFDAAVAKISGAQDE